MRFQLLVHHDAGWPERDQKHGRKDQEEDRKDQFHSDFPGLFLGLLTKARAQILGVRAQRRANADAKTVAVDQQIRQLAQFRLLVARGQGAERVGAGAAGSQLHAKLRELAAQIRVSTLQAAAGVGDGLIQRLAGFHRQHHQIQRRRE